MLLGKRHAGGHTLSARSCSVLLTKCNSRALVLARSWSATASALHYSAICAVPALRQFAQPAKRRAAGVVVQAKQEKRLSANNVAERRTKKQKGSLTSHSQEAAIQQPKTETERRARQTIVYQSAQALRRLSSSRISVATALYMLTQQPSLLHLPAPRLHDRTAQLALTLGLPEADIAELLAANAAFLNILPFRLRGAAEALAGALDLGLRQALGAMAQRFSLLDAPPGWVRGRVEDVAQELGSGFKVAAGMVVRAPQLLDVEAGALAARLASLSKLLELHPTQALQLAVAEPHILLPSSAVMQDNLANLRAALPQLPAHVLKDWLLRAPLLLRVPAHVTAQRLRSLPDVLNWWHVPQRAEPHVVDVQTKGGREEACRPWSQQEWPWQHLMHWQAWQQQQQQQQDNGQPWQQQEHQYQQHQQQQQQQQQQQHQQQQHQHQQEDGQPWLSDHGPHHPAEAALLAYVSRDPRVLLLSWQQLQERQQYLLHLVDHPTAVVHRLVTTHPTYLVIESGAMEAWLHDTKRMLDLHRMTAMQVLACPQVFLQLTMEDMLSAMSLLSRELGLRHSDIKQMVADEPLLLQLAAPGNVERCRAALAAVDAALPNAKALGSLLLRRPRLLLGDGTQLARQLEALARLLQSAKHAKKHSNQASPTTLGHSLQSNSRTSSPSSNGDGSGSGTDISSSNGSSRSEQAGSTDDTAAPLHSAAAERAASTAAPVLDLRLVADAVARQPLLLDMVQGNAGAEAAAAAVRALAGTGLAPPMRLLLLLKKWPGLLGANAQRITSGATALKQLVSSGPPHWSRELRGATKLDGLGCFFLYTRSRLKRLLFLRATQCAEVPLGFALSASRTEWLEECRDFGTWFMSNQDRAFLDDVCGSSNDSDGSSGNGSRGGSGGAHEEEWQRQEGEQQHMWQQEGAFNGTNGGSRPSTVQSAAEAGATGGCHSSTQQAGHDVVLATNKERLLQSIDDSVMQLYGCTGIYVHTQGVQSGAQSKAAPSTHLACI